MLQFVQKGKGLFIYLISKKDVCWDVNTSPEIPHSQWDCASELGPEAAGGSPGLFPHSSLALCEVLGSPLTMCLYGPECVCPNVNLKSQFECKCHILGLIFKASRL